MPSTRTGSRIDRGGAGAIRPAYAPAPTVIAKMLGHSSIEQTLRYIGVDGDDMDAAMKIFKL